MHRLSTASRVLRSAALVDQPVTGVTVRWCSYYKHDSDKFMERHIGPREEEKRQMVQEIGFQTLEEMITATVPASIRRKERLSLSKPLTESQLIQRLQSIAGQNNWDWRSFIGMGYYQCHTPTVIVRNLLENPGIHHPLLHSIPHSLPRPTVRLDNCIHTISGGDRTGTTRVPPQLPDHCLRLDGHASGERLTPGRGNSGC